MKIEEVAISIICGGLVYAVFVYLYYLVKALYSVYRKRTHWESHNIITGSIEIGKVLAVLVAIGVLSRIMYQILYVKG